MRRRALIATAASVSMPALLSRAFAADAGVGDREIIIGQSAVLSGEVGGPLLGFKMGASLAFQWVNDRGGVHGRQIRYISLDDELNPDKTLANYKALLTEHHAFAFFGGVGSVNIAAVTPLLRETNVPLIGSYGLGDSVREKAAGAAYFVRAGYGREAERLVEHLASIGITRISVAHFAFPGGFDVLSAVRAAIKERNPASDVVQSVAVKPDGSDVAAAGITLAKGNAQAVIMFLSGSLVASLIQTMQGIGANPSFYGISLVAGELVAKTVGPRLRGLAVSQVVPYPWSASDAPVREYRGRCAAHKVPVNYYTYEGYINGLVLIEALRRAGRSPTRAGLHAAMRGLKSRIGGLDLDFTTGSPTGSRFVELVHVTADGRFVR